MQPMDIDQVRDLDINMNGLTRANRPYTFYHDETNNIKKLRIDGGALNIADIKVFILGGIVHAGCPRVIDIAPLRHDLRIQTSAREIKLKHVARGEFLELLTSERLSKVLQWLSQNDLFVHYVQLDPLFWSCVDIVDSILVDRPELARIHPMKLKSDLVALLRTDLPATVQLFHAHGYPSLAAHERRPFIEGLLEIIERNEELIGHFDFMMLKGVLQAGRTASSLAFIEDNVRHVLIEQFADFYRARLILFKYSTHIFDEEDTVRDALEAVPLESGGAPFVNHRFANSELEAGIQISDIVVGLLGKMHSYLTETSADEVYVAREALTGVSLDNARLLRDLLAASHAENIAFQQHIGSGHDHEKVDRFLRYEDGRYAS